MRRLATRSVIWKKKGLYINKYEPRHDKTNKVTVRPVWSETSLSAWRKRGSLATHWAHSEDSDQTGRVPRLIWVFAGRTAILLVLSCRGSIMFKPRLLFHKTTAVCSFRTPSTFLQGCFSSSSPLWKDLLAVCLCVHVLWFHVLSNLLLLLRRLPCTLLMLTSPLVLTARELFRYTCTCSMPIILWTWLCLVSYSNVLQTIWC